METLYKLANNYGLALLALGFAVGCFTLVGSIISGVFVSADFAAKVGLCGILVSVLCMGLSMLALVVCVVCSGWKS